VGFISASPCFNRRSFQLISRLYPPFPLRYTHSRKKRTPIGVMNTWVQVLLIRLNAQDPGIGSRSYICCQDLKL
jgi:hypothetical protein